MQEVQGLSLTVVNSSLLKYLVKSAENSIHTH